MAKKKVTLPVKEVKSFSKEEIDAALEILHSEYFMQTVALLSHTKEQDLTFVRVPVTTPDGGTYLVSILHVDGPKVQLQQLAKSAEEQEKLQK